MGPWGLFVYVNARTRQVIRINALAQGQQRRWELWQIGVYLSHLTGQSVLQPVVPVGEYRTDGARSSRGTREAMIHVPMYSCLYLWMLVTNSDLKQWKTNKVDGPQPVSVTPWFTRKAGFGLYPYCVTASASEHRDYWQLWAKGEHVDLLSGFTTCAIIWNVVHKGARLEARDTLAKVSNSKNGWLMKRPVGNSFLSPSGFHYQYAVWDPSGRT